MNFAIATLVGVCVYIWNQPTTLARLHKLRLTEDLTFQFQLVDQLKYRFRRKSERDALLQRLIDGLAALDAELKSGQPPNLALARAADDPPLWPTALAAIGIGGDVAQALRVDAEKLPQLRQLAACWEVGSRSGSGLSAAIGQLLQSTRQNEELRATLEAELAAPRATAKILSGLPLIGILMGIMMGSDPVGWLVGNPMGWGCLVTGLLLTAIGAAWSQRMVHGVERLL
jgi:tight adherence protein B